MLTYLYTKLYIQSNLFIPTFDRMTKFIITTVWMEWYLSSRWGRSLEIFKSTVFNAPRNICCGYLLELPHQGLYNKYPQHMFLAVNKGKKTFYNLSYWYMLGFFIVANSLILGDECCHYNEVLLYFMDLEMAFIKDNSFASNIDAGRLLEPLHQVPTNCVFEPG